MYLIMSFVVKKYVIVHSYDRTYRNANHMQAIAKTFGSLICSGYVEKKK